MKKLITLYLLFSTALLSTTGIPWLDKMKQDEAEKKAQPIVQTQPAQPVRQDDQSTQLGIVWYSSVDIVADNANWENYVRQIVRPNFNRINGIKNWRTINKEQRYDLGAGRTLVTYYYSNNGLEKIVADRNSSGSRIVTEFYFLGQYLSFVYERTNYNNSRVREKRAYFRKKEFFRFLDNMKKNPTSWDKEQEYYGGGSEARMNIRDLYKALAGANDPQPSVPQYTQNASVMTTPPPSNEITLVEKVQVAENARGKYLKSYGDYVGRYRYMDGRIADVSEEMDFLLNDVSFTGRIVRKDYQTGQIYYIEHWEDGLLMTDKGENFTGWVSFDLLSTALDEKQKNSGEIPTYLKLIIWKDNNWDYWMWRTGNGLISQFKKKYGVGFSGKMDYFHEGETKPFGYQIWKNGEPLRTGEYDEYGRPHNEREGPFD